MYVCVEEGVCGLDICEHVTIHGIVLTRTVDREGHKLGYGGVGGGCMGDSDGDVFEAGGGI